MYNNDSDKDLKEEDDIFDVNHLAANNVLTDMIKNSDEFSKALES